MSIFEVAQRTPAWLQTLLLSAVTGVVVYWWKEWTTGIKRKREERISIAARLHELKSLLAASYSVVMIQQGRALALVKMLKENHPSESSLGNGLEDTIARCYPVFNDEEKELHGIVRAYSEHSMRRVNEALQKWVESDRHFKSGQVKSQRKDALANRLREMEMHLLLWFAKFENWLPNQPQHALVWMDDEKQHGLGFPSERQREKDGIKMKVDSVDTEVNRVLQELQQRWKLQQW